MYRNLRRRISLIMALGLVLLFAGTLLIIYSSSYREVLREDREMLSLYAEAYWINGLPQEDAPPDLPPDAAALPRSGQFFSVERSPEGALGNLLLPKDAEKTELLALAEQLFAQGRTDGTAGKWVWHRAERDGRTLLVFLDNTLVRSSYLTLLRNTAVYGALLLGILILGAVLAARRFVRPLEEADRDQKRFLSDAGHELKTPCSVISANAELLERQIGQNRWLENIKAENTRQIGLVTSLLLLNRAEEDPVLAAPVDLSALAEGMILPFEGIAFERGHTLVSDIRPEVLVRGSEKMLSSLLSVLLDNAVSHALPGSDIRISLDRSGRHAVLEAENPCAPLAAGQMEHLFDRFYRTDPARTDNSHYGMGLSIARRIAESHGGTLTAAFREGKIVFRAVLPLWNKKG